MTLEEALPLLRALSATDKLRLIDELAKEVLAERAAEAAATLSTAAPASSLNEPPDPADETRWTAWLDSLLDAAEGRIHAAQREMRARGILDGAGRLLTDALPADMLPASRASVSTG